MRGKTVKQKAMFRSQFVNLTKVSWPWYRTVLVWYLSPNTFQNNTNECTERTLLIGRTTTSLL